MSLQDFGVLIAIIASLATGIYTVVKSQHSDEERISSLELKLAAYGVKIDTLWDFLLRRAASEAVLKGFGEMNSPLVLNDEAQSWFSGMADELRSWYQQNGLNLNDRDLMISLERYFGDRMLQEVCIPNGLTAGSCLLIAATVAKGGDATVEV